MGRIKRKRAGMAVQAVAMKVHDWRGDKKVGELIRRLEGLYVGWKDYTWVGRIIRGLEVVIRRL